jgi:AcrR family transcriptional regulator
MLQSKRQIKESNIIEAAERIFSSVGFKNAKMDDIAVEAGITKVTLYSYMHSKENLYMSITYKALQLLNDEYYLTIDKFKNKSGADCVVALAKTFMDFCESNYLYSEALLEYYAIIRSTSRGEDNSKLSDAMKESISFMKLQNIHNLPFKLTIQEMQRGLDDGSIHPSLDPAIQTIYGWASIIGYVKVISASGQNATPFLKIDPSILKEHHLRTVRHVLTSGIT